MADKYNKLEPKVPKEVLYGLAGFFILIVALFFIIRPNNQEKVYQAFSTVTTSEDFTEEHPFYEVSYKQLMKKIESETYVFVFIGSPDNTSSAAYIGAFQKYYESEGADEYAEYIYYFNAIDDLSGLNDLSEDFELVDGSGNQLVLFINGEDSVAFEENGTSDSQLINRASRDFFEDAIEAIEDAA